MEKPAIKSEQTEKKSDNEWKLPSLMLDLPALFGIKSISILELPTVETSIKIEEDKEDERKDRLPEIVRAIEKSLDEQEERSDNKSLQKRSSSAAHHRNNVAAKFGTQLLSKKNTRAKRQALGGMGGMGMGGMSMGGMGMAGMGLGGMGGMGGLGGIGGMGGMGGMGMRGMGGMGGMGGIGGMGGMPGIGGQTGFGPGPVSGQGLSSKWLDKKLKKKFN